MAKANRALIHRAQRTDCHCASAVLNLGASVASLSTRASCLFELNRFLDEAVLEELLAERRSLADDLDLLESLSEANSTSPDSEALATALLGRIENLLAREDRVLYQPLLRLAERQAEDHNSQSEEASR
ncbi:MAG: hypothetical protein GY769_14975 [bacterium]|nr:hypothetical protein [bacterium]